jgi:hypothetical protein
MSGRLPLVRVAPSRAARGAARRGLRGWTSSTADVAAARERSAFATDSRLGDLDPGRRRLGRQGLDVAGNEAAPHPGRPGDHVVVDGPPLRPVSLPRHDSP